MTLKKKSFDGGFPPMNGFEQFAETVFNDLESNIWTEIQPKPGEKLAPLNDVDLQLMKEAGVTNEEIEHVYEHRTPTLARALKELTKEGDKAYVDAESLKRHLGMDDKAFDKFITKTKANNWKHRTYAFEGDRVGFSKQKRDRIRNAKLKAKELVHDQDMVRVEWAEYNETGKKSDQRTIQDLLESWDGKKKSLNENKEYSLEELYDAVGNYLKKAQNITTKKLVSKDGKDYIKIIDKSTDSIFAFIEKKGKLQGAVREAKSFSTPGTFTGSNVFDNSNGTKYLLSYYK